MKKILIVCLLSLLAPGCKKASDVDPQPTTPTPTPTPKSGAKEILSFAFEGLAPIVTAEIGASPKTIKATVPYGTPLTSLVPTIGVSEKATLSPASGVAQNFTNGLTYTVAAEDGTKQEYKASVTVAAFNGGLYKLFSEGVSRTLAHKTGESLFMQPTDRFLLGSSDSWEFDQPSPLVTPAGYSIYTIRNKGTGIYLAVRLSDNSLTYTSGASVQGYSTTWTVEPVRADGPFYIRNRGVNRVLIANSGGVVAGTNAGYASEQWKLNK